VKHDWVTQQQEVLASAEEFDLLEQYKIALQEAKQDKEAASR
jgi:hypothetical protein